MMVLHNYTETEMLFNLLVWFAPTLFLAGCAYAERKDRIRALCFGMFALIALLIPAACISNYVAAIQ